MRLFFDASAVLAACRSETGASREILDAAGINDWRLLSCPYAMIEVGRNVPKLGAPAVAVSQWLLPRLGLVDDVTVIDKPAVFQAGKDRPILFTAYANAEVLITLDRRDFMAAIGRRFYHLDVLTPGEFLERERMARRYIAS